MCLLGITERTCCANSLQDGADEDEKKFNKKISDLKGMLRKLEERNKQLVEDKADLVGQENGYHLNPKETLLCLCVSDFARFYL